MAKNAAIFIHAPTSLGRLIYTFILPLSEHFLKPILDKCDKNYKIIVVDNFSFDDSISFIKKNFDMVNLIINRSNFGFAKGNNIGFNYSKGKYIFSLNPDVRLDSICIHELLKVAKNNSTIGICVQKI